MVAMLYFVFVVFVWGLFVCGGFFCGFLFGWLVGFFVNVVVV